MVLKQDQNGWEKAISGKIALGLVCGNEDRTLVGEPKLCCFFFYSEAVGWRQSHRNCTFINRSRLK